MSIEDMQKAGNNSVVSLEDAKSKGLLLDEMLK
jgi:hypothetical protein